ncbi:P protein-like [Tropilaelaps mercedesae]|uniref:P protein-like n=1 Tax=Tropilaelaps mercedesae TaxID=418985 RepID=A0A1V9XS50_9ACAR|nr:P protein-like [Tropilaelaps mercedesae]
MPKCRPFSIQDIYWRELRDTPYLKLSNADEDGGMSTEPSIDGEEPRSSSRFGRRSRRGHNGPDADQGESSSSTRTANVMQESSLTQSGQLQHTDYESSDSDSPPHGRCGFDLNIKPCSPSSSYITLPAPVRWVGTWTQVWGAIRNAARSSGSSDA